MKLFTRPNIYKANNVTFNPETLEAHSYGWWQFVCNHKGKVIFNNVNYSNSTIKHQYKVKNLLTDLGIKLGIFLHHTKESLSDINKAMRDEISCLDNINLELLILTEKKGTRKTKNIERLEDIEVNKLKIEELVRCLI